MAKAEAESPKKSPKNGKKGAAGSAGDSVNPAIAFYRSWSEEFKEFALYLFFGKAGGGVGKGMECVWAGKAFPAA